MCTHNVNKNNQRYFGKEHAGHKSKSGWPVRPFSTCSTLFLLYVPQNVKTFQEYTVFHLFTEYMDGLCHKITEWCIKCGTIKHLKIFFSVLNNV